jgi:hypothetical protein
MMLETPFGPVHFTLDEQMQYPDRFFVWIVDHMDLYREFVDRARNAKAWGAESYGAKAIFETMRWDWLKKQRRRRGKPRDPFAMNNNHTAGLARLAMRQFPELRGFFKCRGRDGNDVKQEQAA